MDRSRYLEGKVGQWPIIDHRRQITPAAALVARQPAASCPVGIGFDTIRGQ
jgi:hypothetical protein